MAATQKIKDEPVVSLFMGLVAAIIAVLVAFGVALTAIQIAAITGLFGALIPVVLYVRKRVTPNHKV